MGRVVFKISVGFVTAALILLALSLYLSNHYLQEQLRLAETGDFQDARADVEWAARLDPFGSDPPTAEAYIESRQGRTGAAVEDFREAIRREPVNYANYVALGDLQNQQLGDPAAAAKSYEKALEYNPHANAVVSRLAEALLNAGDLEGAKAQYEWLQKYQKISPKELYTLGEIQTRLGDPEEAIDTFKNAREALDAAGTSSGSEEEKKTLLDSLDLATANALVVQGSYDEARGVLEQSSAEQAPTVLSLLNDDPEAYRESVLDAPIS